VNFNGPGAEEAEMITDILHRACRLTARGRLVKYEVIIDCVHKVWEKAGKRHRYDQVQEEPGKCTTLQHASPYLIPL
jgi:hypothetical protein